MKTFITKHRKGIKRMLIGCGIVAALGAAVIFGMDVYVVHYAKGYVYETGAGKQYAESRLHIGIRGRHEAQWGAKLNAS